ncbi:MAG: nucleotidyltransferase [Acidimicrobiaceae bacterium]|nr:nucleotidyltransferase [Acidimicrobiaceae bacterium]MYI55082.1 nucleotidyltransferase [Acidimicrobiaceae bacterium]
MPNSNLQVTSRVLDATAGELDISPQQFALAEHRYTDLGQWLVAQGVDEREVYPQGSFRLGTVLRPTAGGDFDIDLVHLRLLTKESITQKELRAQAGQLLTDYITVRGASNGNPTLKERGRCWELIYAGDRFHMDVLPVIPDPDGDDTAVLLSDRDLFLWQHSNPIGYADWFWSSMGEAVDVARAQLAVMLSRDVEDVPQWLVRTALQRVVQLLKLHRDRFFRSNPQDKPASILITTLATHAYGGESDLYEAFRKVARSLPSHVEWRNGTWWVPNPAHEEENFADKWNTNPDRKRHFDRWVEALVADTDRWATSNGVDEAVRSLGTALGAAPVQAGAKRVGVGLSSLAAAGGLSVVQQGRVTDRSGTKIQPHDFHGPDR